MIAKTMRPVVLAVLFALPAFGAVAAEGNPALRDVSRQKDAEAVTDWENGTIEVVGRGFARRSGNLVQDELLAVEAARAVAYARLAERVGSVRVTSTTTIGAAEGGPVQTQLQAVIRGAREAGRRVWAQDDGSRAAEITLRLCLTSAGKDCAGVAAPVTSITPPEPPAPVAAPPVPVVQAPIAPVSPTPLPPRVAVPTLHTGLVISVGKLPYLPVLKPEVATPDGTIVFNAAKVARQIVANDGAVQYAGSLVDAGKRPQAGANPLIVKAIKLTDDNRIVISEADATLVSAANSAAGDFIKNGKVIIAFEG